jgi:hypothetical protein
MIATGIQTERGTGTGIGIGIGIGIDLVMIGTGETREIHDLGAVTGLGGSDSLLSASTLFMIHWRLIATCTSLLSFLALVIGIYCLMSYVLPSIAKVSFHSTCIALMPTFI